MAEKLVANLLDQLISVPASQLQNNINLVRGVGNEVVNLSSKLTMIQRRLRDVERRRLGDRAVGDWHDKLQDLAYEMDDALDEWNTQIHKYRIEVVESLVINDPSPTLFEMVRSFFLTYCLCYREVSIRWDIARKIKDLNARLNRIYKEWEDFNFVELDSKEFQPLPSTSDFDESELQGRQNGKDAVIEQLIPSENHDHDIRIVSIVGPGGIGKTTLAQVVFNDNRLNFDLRKWVCVSDPFDQKMIAKAILEDPNESSFSDNGSNYSLTTLVQRIKALVSEKKFLLVLDDVWTENNNEWEPIWNSLKFGAPASRILVTTRSERVARVLGTNFLYPLGELQDSDCWTILSRIAFSRRSQNRRERFAEFRIEMSKKCMGLPLAAKFLGSLLQFKDTVDQWKNVLESEIWELENNIRALEKKSVGLFPHIYLSYNELSSELKRCFLYCAVFLKDSEIDVDELIKEWMAQGYLMSTTSFGEPESWGYECFSNLAMRSFFQNLVITDEGRIIKCKMHDIVHDFAKYLANGECLVIPNQETLSRSGNSVRHLRWLRPGNVAVSRVISDVSKLRSFHNFGYSDAPDHLFRLKCVRVLSLRYTWVRQVPRDVGKLIHLRFLDLRGNPFAVLPDEIGDLYNLETLDISGCDGLTCLPERIGNLTNLRHLLNSSEFGIDQLSQGLKRLTSLRTLSVFKVGNGYDKFEYLKNLNQLGGELKIEFHEVDEEDFDVAALEGKNGIKKINLVFRDRTNYATLLEPLRVPPNLECVELYNYTGSNLPSWIMSLNNVRRLGITHGRLVALPALGQLPSLEQLKLFNLVEIETLGREFMVGGRRHIDAGPISIFPKLKKLELEYLSNLKTWEDLREEDESNVVMPCLEELQLHYCYGLKNLPRCLLRMAHKLDLLELDGCPFLTTRYRGEEDWNHISRIPNVIFDGEKQN